MGGGSSGSYSPSGRRWLGAVSKGGEDGKSVGKFEIWAGDAGGGGGGGDGSGMQGLLQPTSLLQVLTYTLHTLYRAALRLMP
jgi:hypothetical protein